jgi:hypothetical protein
MPSQARELLSKLFRWFEKRKRPKGISAQDGGLMGL